MQANLIIHIIAGLGIVQGAILVAALYRARNLNPTGFFCLSIALAATMGIIIEEWIVFSGGWRDLPHVLRATTWMPYLIGPSIWLFACSLRSPDELRWSRLHYLPAAIALLYFMPFYLQSGDAKIAFVDGTHAIPLETTLHGAAKAVSLLGYLAASLVVLWRLPKSPLTLSAFWSVLAFLVFAVLVASNFATEHVTRGLPISSDMLAIIGLAAFLYALSLLVLVHWRGFATASPPEPAVRAPGLLDAETATRLFAEIESQVIAGELHLEPQLTVARLAETTGFQPHYLSYVINASTGLNVKAWLNSLRVEEAKRQLSSDTETAILDIALACGFNSKAAFNRAFRASVGQSPSDYRASHFAK